jgi:UDPglucose 6-dehydrogenase
MTKPPISVIGIGYVGLCTALAFASKGFKVIASDNDEEKVSKIRQGIAPFFEYGIQGLLENALQKANFKCLSNQTRKVILETDLTFITIGTPSKPNGDNNLQFMKSATRDIGKAISQKDKYHLVIVKSTVLPGTTQKIIKTILEKESTKKCGVDFGLCMNPEFLQQGSALKNILHPDRIIIGTYDEKSGSMLGRVYKAFYGKNLPPIIMTSLPTAELIKYASNSFLATKISFINMIADICEKIPGGDVKTVATAMGLDKRIGQLFLNAGLGYGGSCFPKDLKALITLSKKFGFKPQLLEAVENINNKQSSKAVQFCKEQLGKLEGKRISILGLAFKPNTDDMREAQSIPIITQLIQEGARIIVYDPVAIPAAKIIFKNKIEYATSIAECLENAECCILVTEWSEFKKLEPEDFIKKMKHPILIDGRRIYNPELFGQKLKFTAIGLGPSKYANAHISRGF